MAAGDVNLQTSFETPVSLDIHYSQEYKLSDTYLCDPRRDHMIKGAHPIFVENGSKGYQAVFGKDLTAEPTGSQRDPTLKELKQVVEGRANKFGYGVCVGEADSQGHRHAYIYDLNLNVIPKNLEAFQPRMDAQFVSLKATPAVVDKLKDKLKKGDELPSDAEIDRHLRDGIKAVYAQNIEIATQATQCQGRDKDQGLFPLLGHHLNLTQNEALTLLELGPIPTKFYCFEPTGPYFSRNVRLQLTGWSELILETLSNLTGFRKEEITMDTDFRQSPFFTNPVLNNPIDFFSSHERVAEIADSLRFLISGQLRAEKMMKEQQTMMGKQFWVSSLIGIIGVGAGLAATVPIVLAFRKPPTVKQTTALVLICSTLFCQLV